jgi:hypothetical protein
MVNDRDGRRLGRIVAARPDPVTGEPEWLTLAPGWRRPLGRRYVVPAARLRPVDGDLVADVPRELVEAAPFIDQQVGWPARGRTALAAHYHVGRFDRRRGPALHPPTIDRRV